MDIKELRIDNWVDYGRQGIVKFTLDMFAICHRWPKDVIYIRPIPITDKWLRQFGFSQDRARLFLQIDFGEYWKWDGWQFVSSPYHSLETLQTSVSLYDKRQWPLGNPMIYVHQLQNRYYSLTYKELPYYEQTTP